MAEKKTYGEIDVEVEKNGVTSIVKKTVLLEHQFWSLDKENNSEGKCEFHNIILTYDYDKKGISKMEQTRSSSIAEPDKKNPNETNK